MKFVVLLLLGSLIGYCVYDLTPCFTLQARQQKLVRIAGVGERRTVVEPKLKSEGYRISGAADNLVFYSFSRRESWIVEKLKLMNYKLPNVMLTRLVALTRDNGAYINYREGLVVDVGLLD